MLTRYLGEELVEPNPGLSDITYHEALRVVCEMPFSTNSVAVNKDSYSLHRNSVEVSSDFKALVTTAFDAALFFDTSDHILADIVPLRT